MSSGRTFATWHALGLAAIARDARVLFFHRDPRQVSSVDMGFYEIKLLLRSFDGRFALLQPGAYDYFGAGLASFMFRQQGQPSMSGSCRSQITRYVRRHSISSCLAHWPSAVSTAYPCFPSCLSAASRSSLVSSSNHDHANVSCF